MVLLWWQQCFVCLGGPDCGERSVFSVHKSKSSNSIFVEYLFHPCVSFFFFFSIWWNVLCLFGSILGVECPCFCWVTLSLPSPCRLKQRTCCSINAETRKPPPNLSLRPRWEEPPRQPTITWTQTEEPRREGTRTETHTANRDTRTHTQSYFSDRGLRRL